MTPEQTEQRTFHCPCGNELIVCFNETERWDEQEFAALDNARWIMVDAGYFCPDCKDDAPESHGEFIDHKVDELRVV